MNLPIKKHAKIAVLGHHGIPSNYGGFETFAEEIGKNLVERGYHVVGYCRSNYYTLRPAEYKGIKLVYLPTIVNKYLDTFVHTLISVFHVIFKNTADVLLLVNVGNAPFAAIAKLFGKKVIFCVDGLDWERKKWGAFAKWYLRTCSRMVPYVAHEVVTDAYSVQEFYREQRKTESSFIPYGTTTDGSRADEEVLKPLGLAYKKYFIYVARFEPENHPLKVVQAYVKSGSSLPLVMVGDNRYSPEYVKEVKAAAGNKNVLFLGYVFGTRYKELVKGSLAYLRASEVGGFNPAIIEAMGRGTCIVANDRKVYRELLGNSGLYYDLNDDNSFADLLARISVTPEAAVLFGKLGMKRAEMLFNWNKITDEYIELIEKLSPTPKETVMPAVSFPAYTKATN